MEHVLLLAIAIGSKYHAISRARSDNTLIITNQERASIDRRGHNYRGIHFGNQKICNKISIDLRRNNNEVIAVKPPISIGSIRALITSLESGTEIQKSHLGRILMMTTHQETLGFNTSSVEACWVFLTGACHGMAQQKVKVKILKVTKISKRWARESFSSWNSWARKDCSFESRQFKSHQHGL